MKVRDYQTEDCESCLALFDSNVPRFFAPHERAEFAEFLATSTDPYFVVLDDHGQIIGCGGYYLNRERAAAGLTWGMVSNHLHRQGVGRFLLLARLRRLSQEQDIATVLINTSQHSYGFFAKIGFVVEAVVKNGFAAGLHEYKMSLPLSSETRQRLLANS